MKLYTKVVLYMAPVFLSGAWAAIYSARGAVHRAEFSDLMKESLFEIHEIQPPLTRALQNRDTNDELAQLQELARNIGDSSYIALYDSRARLVARTNGGDRFPAAGDADVSSVLASGAPLMGERWEGGRGVALIVVPAHPASILRIAIPLDNLKIREREIANILLRIIGACGGVAALLLGLIIRRVLAPIGLLLEGTKKIHHGDYGASVAVTTNDEIGELGRGFNAMSASLAATTVSKDFLDNILKTMQDPLIVTDVAGRVTMVNPAVPALLGYAAPELKAFPAAALIEDGKAILGPIDGAPNEGIRSAHFLRKDGQKIPVLISLAPLRDADGKTMGLVVSAKDVSEIKKMEGRMQQTEKLSAVGQLAAGVAHEINNPLGVILGFAQGMSRQTKAGDPLELPIKSIEREALRCKNLVQDLLTFARTSQTDREGMDVNRVIEQAMSLVQSQVRMGSVQFKVELAAALPMILGNKNQIQQVILNLAKNALDAMPSGGALTIKTELVESSPQSWVCLEVADTGSGIPPEIQARIYEPFFTTKTVGQGTGLGLSLVSEIVKKHSGEIDVVSATGRTVFRVKFPARTGREIAQRASELQLEKLAAPVVYQR